MNNNTKRSKDKDKDIRKDVKPLTEVFNVVGILQFCRNFKIKEILTYTIDGNEVPRSTCYPFQGRYIDVVFDETILFCKDRDIESEVREGLGCLINQALSCTSDFKMSNYAKLIYHVDCEKVGNLLP